MSTVAVVLGVLVVAFAVLVRWVRSPYGWLTVRVDGASMEPALHDGDRILARRYRGARVRPGDVVVFARPPAGLHPTLAGATPPRLPDMWIKRVAAVAGDPLPPGVPDNAVLPPGTRHVPPGAVVVFGDRPSLDSRAFGPVPLALVVGVVRATGRAGPAGRGIR